MHICQICFGVELWDHMCRVTLDLDHKDVCYRCFEHYRNGSIMWCTSLASHMCIWCGTCWSDFVKCVIVVVVFWYVSTSLYSVRHVCMCFLWLTFACLLLEFAARFGVHVWASNFALGEGAKLCPTATIPKFKKMKIFVWLWSLLVVVLEWMPIYELI